MPECQIIHGDALEVMAGMESNSIDLIATDPPYYRFKNLPWDSQWDNPAEFVEWIGKLCAEWQRILKANGSLYVFASPKMAARVECGIAEWFNVLNRITWRKHDGTHNEGGSWSRSNKDILRRFFEQKEEIIFAEHYGADNAAKGESGYGAKCDELRGFVFEPLRAYLDGERKRAGLRTEDIGRAWMNWKGKESKWVARLAGHWFERVQWALPTPENYAWLQNLFNAGCNGSGSEYLRREYEDLRRPFCVTADVPYTDVWDFSTVHAYQGKHPCEKPLDMMTHIISASSRQGAMVLDCFCGSGATGVAALRLGRRFIGIELSKHWADYTRNRIANDSPLFAKVT